MGPVQLEVADLLLDLENPRIVGAKSQREALQKIVGDQKEKLLVLARSIVEDEGMNPMDRLLVLKAKDGFTVLEGNRRLAALKILSAPSTLDNVPISTGLRRAFAKLAERFDRKTVEPLPCFEIADREDGVKWLHQRHTGENGGKGVVAWSGIAASRFRGQDTALQTLAFVTTHGGLTEHQTKLLEDFPITTLNRLLSSREVRSRLGFDVKKGKLVSGLPPEELLKPLRQIVLDLAEGRKNVSQLKNKTQQVEYIETDFPKASLPSLSKTRSVRPVEEIVSGDFGKKPTPTGSHARPRTKRDTTERGTLVPSKGVALSIGHRRIALIFDELRKVKVAHAPNAVAVLFRVFLELSVDHYMDKQKLPMTIIDKGGYKKDKSLRAKVTEVVAHLVAEGRNKKDFNAVLRALITSHSPLSMELLNDYVHNRFTTPKAADLLASWDDAQQLFEALWA